MRSKGLWSLKKQLELLCLLFDDDLPVETSIKRAIGAPFNPKHEMFEIRKQVKCTCEEQLTRPYDKGFF
jgi:hypothetical protein